MLSILITNDDGIHTRGIKQLAEELGCMYNVYVVAPDRERSATGHSISLHDPIRVKELERGRVYSIDGTPVDSVHVALLGLIKKPVFTIVSGINFGLNLGQDVFYSGTVSAAFQANTFGIHGIAISIDREGDKIYYETASRVALALVKKLESLKGGARFILNVNVPNLPFKEIRGIEITRLGKRIYRDKMIEREDPKKNKYFWFEGGNIEDVLEPGTDVYVVRKNRVSITPLTLDLTAYNDIEMLKDEGFSDILE